MTSSNCSTSNATCTYALNQRNKWVAVILIFNSFSILSDHSTGGNPWNLNRNLPVQHSQDSFSGMLVSAGAIFESTFPALASISAASSSAKFSHQLPSRIIEEDCDSSRGRNRVAVHNIEAETIHMKVLCLSKRYYSLLCA